MHSTSVKLHGLHFANNSNNLNLYWNMDRDENKETATSLISNINYFGCWRLRIIGNIQDFFPAYIWKLPPTVAWNFQIPDMIRFFLVVTYFFFLIFSIQDNSRYFWKLKGETDFWTEQKIMTFDQFSNSRQATKLPNIHCTANTTFVSFAGFKSS